MIIYICAILLTVFSIGLGQDEKNDLGTLKILYGKVIDVDSLPIAGADIYLKKYMGETRTDSEGNFRLNIDYTHISNSMKSSNFLNNFKTNQVPKGHFTVLGKRVKRTSKMSSVLLNEPQKPIHFDKKIMKNVKQNDNSSKPTFKRTFSYLPPNIIDTIYITKNGYVPEQRFLVSISYDTAYNYDKIVLRNNAQSHDFAKLQKKWKYFNSSRQRKLELTDLWINLNDVVKRDDSTIINPKIIGQSINEPPETRWTGTGNQDTIIKTWEYRFGGCNGGPDAIEFQFNYEQGNPIHQIPVKSFYQFMNSIKIEAIQPFPNTEKINATWNAELLPKYELLEMKFETNGRWSWLSYYSTPDTRDWLMREIQRDWYMFEYNAFDLNSGMFEIPRNKISQGMGNSFFSATLTAKTEINHKPFLISVKKHFGSYFREAIGLVPCPEK